MERSMELYSNLKWSGGLGLHHPQPGPSGVQREGHSSQRPCGSPSHTSLLPPRRYFVQRYRLVQVESQKKLEAGNSRHFWEIDNEYLQT